MDFKVLIMKTMRFASIILHVGLPKTATTSIQNYCSQQAKSLEKHGIHYPTSWPSNHSIPIAYIAQSRIHIERITIKNQQLPNLYCNTAQGWMEFFINEIQSTNAETLLLSSEIIPDFDESSLHHLNQYLHQFTKSVSLIMYVRHPVALAESLIPTMLLHNRITRHQADQRLHKLMHNYTKIRIQRLQRVFGHDALKVFTYEDARQHPNTSVGHFLDRIGVKTIESGTFPNTENTRPSQVSCDILDIYNRHKQQSPPTHTRDNLIKLFELTGPLFHISMQQRHELFMASQSDREWLYSNLHIDYREPPVVSTHSQSLSTEDTKYKESVVRVFNTLSPTLQRATVEHLQTNASDLFDTDQMEFFMQSSVAKQRFIAHLPHNQLMNSDTIYVTCAAVLAAHNDFAAAITMLQCALRFNPSSAHIQQKLHEYHTYISSYKHTHG